MRRDSLPGLVAEKNGFGKLARRMDDAADAGPRFDDGVFKEKLGKRTQFDGILRLSKQIDGDEE